MRAPDNKVPPPIRALARDLCARWGAEHAATIERMANLSVWAQLAKQHHSATKSPIRFFYLIIQADDEAKLWLFFLLACQLAVDPPLLPSQREVEARQAADLEMAAKLEREVERYRLLGDDDAERCLRDAASIYSHHAATTEGVFRGSVVRRKRNLGGRSFCRLLGGVYREYFGDRHLNEFVARIACAALKRTDINPRLVRHWRS